VENPRFLFLRGSADVVAAAGVAAATPPAISAAHASASAARAASLVGCLAAGAPTPAEAPSPPLPPWLWARGVKAPTSRGEPGPHRFPPPPRLTTSTPRSQVRRAPTTRAVGTPHSFAPDAPVAGCSAPSCAPSAPSPAAAPHACVLGLGAWEGRIAQRS
jgi:hypothetical protein